MIATWPPHNKFKVGTIGARVGPATPSSSSNVPPWVPYPGSSAHFDFVNQRYFWGGLAHDPIDFATFTAPAWGAGTDQAGLLPSSSTNITLAWSAIGLSNPFVMAAVYYPTATPAGVCNVATVDGGSTDANGELFRMTSTTKMASVVNVASSAVVGATTTNAVALNTRHAQASSFETNNTATSIDGAVNGMILDTVCAMPTVTTVRFARSSNASQQLLGSLRHVLFFSGAMSQAQLDSLTSNLLAI